MVGVQSGETPAGPRLQARFSHFFADERIGEQLSSVALPSLLELETKDKRRIARFLQSWRLKDIKLVIRDGRVVMSSYHGVNVHLA